jgi:Ca2+-transporting ATPase
MTPPSGNARADAPTPWALGAGELCQALGVDPTRGLEPEEVLRRRRTHGPNLLRELRPTPAWRLLVAQFASWIVGLLVAAALVALAFHETLDAIAIAVVLVLNALIGFVTELRAVRSMEALRRLGSVETRVVRGGREERVDAVDLVPGDVLLLEGGDVVTADARLCEAAGLEVDESALTGESEPVAKAVDAVAREAALHARSPMLHKGTAVTGGSARVVVTGTGMETELGRIARLVQEADKSATPLEVRLAGLGRRLVGVVLVVALVTAVAGILSGREALLMVETGVALAVAAIPEGLPVVATLALARGMWRLARRSALINRLAAVETLGATTVILSDKTGTLTENRMAARRVALEGAEVQLGPEGLEAGGAPHLREAVEAAVLCSNAVLAEDARAEGADGDRAGDLGDPTELALLRLGRAVGVERRALEEREPRLAEFAFDPCTRRMATVHREGGGVRVAVKGAAEAVLPLCTRVLEPAGGAAALDEAARRAWEERAAALAADGLRVLALAGSRREALPEDPFEDLTLLALVGLADPPRATVAGAVAACHRAGIRVVMVTGDHAGTAAAIARAVGIVPEGETRVVQGTDLEREADPLLPRVFARVSPEQKLALVAAYQAAGHVVAMTGDGVNDAPALRKADIGVAMGRRGTQVAREAADMVLVDDAFESIVAAVEQGRVLFDNVRRFVVYLLSCNVSEVLVVTAAAVVGGPLPLLPLQILFLNLVTDVFPALALGFGEGDRDVLERPPRDPREPVLTRAHWREVAGYAALLSASVLLALLAALHGLHYEERAAVTVSFLTLATSQLLHVFNVRGRGSSLLGNDVVRNPWIWAALLLCAGLILLAVHWPLLAGPLQLVTPDLRGWALVVGASLLPLAVGQVLRSRPRPAAEGAAGSGAYR